MQKYDFLLMYEHKVRELDNLCLLKYELDKRGYKTKILYENDFELVQSRKMMYTTSVLVIGYCYTGSSIRDYASYRIKFDKVINLQWEQVTTNEQEKNSDSFRNLSGLAKEIVHIAWGEKNRERLLDKAGVAPDNVKVAGNIAMDLVRPEFSGFYLARDELCNRYELAANKKICLFIASFKCVEESEQVKEESIKRFGEGRRRYLAVADKEQLTILQWFERLLTERDDYQIIYRPHPGDASPRACALAERFDNFKVISELSVKQWIMNCDFIYSWNSTAMIEAFFAGKNPIFLCPYPIPEDQDHPLLMKMNKVTDYSGFYRTLSGDQPSLGLTKEMVNPYYLVDEEEASYIKAADAFEEVYKCPDYAWNRKQRREYKRLYSAKERITIWFMGQDRIYKLYEWMLEKIPLGFLKKRKEWLKDYKRREENRWRAMNAAEVGDYDNEAETIISRIKEIVEVKDENKRMV